MEVFQKINQSIPIQMYSCTDSNGTIHPQKFKFQEKDGTIHTYDILRIHDKKELPGNYILFEVVVENYGTEKIVRLSYRLLEHKWKLLL